MASNAASVSIQIRHFFGDIKLSHSIFALPFAISTFWFIAPQFPSILKILGIIVAIVTARTFAMGMNRFLDRHIDGDNARTAQRAIPSGKLKPYFGLLFSLLSGVLFVITSFLLNPFAGYLSLFVAPMLAGYSMMKRLSYLTHWYLGACLGIAPLGVSVVLTGGLDFSAVLLGIATAFWTGGFDLIYSLQDADHDKLKGLHSFPSKFGRGSTLKASRISFAIASLCFAIIGLIEGLNIIYWSTILIILILFVLEHILVFKEERAKKYMNAAFFTANACVSIIYFIGLSVDKVIFL